MKSTAIGSAVSVLLAFSAISYAKSYQDRKSAQPTPAQTSNQQPVNPESKDEPAIAESATALSSSVVEKSAPSKSNADFEVAPQTYTATAYSLRGRTSSGKPVSRGLIAADPSVLPLGTRVRVDAGSFSGEYLVADTGGSVKGRRIDIWTPTSREALQFGRRAVKLTVLSFGGKRAKSALIRPRLVHPLALPPATQQTLK
ncbi:MAG: hypothetical protein QOH70_2439 [Blastocatellia bacterium]|jgi:3D (Asp-Asp-Asp) domain-containing protein|nr:hypothetical protein [Blastocatellia bacterium]